MTLRTWNNDKRCAMCCNGDRCDDPRCLDRATCPHCKSTGWALWTDAGQADYVQYLQGWHSMSKEQARGVLARLGYPSTPAQAPQHVLKAEAATPDATDRGEPASTSPGVGPTGAGQPADAGPTAGQSDPTVISWDIEEVEQPDGFRVFNVVGTSDECRVTFNCIDDITAELLVHKLNSSAVVGVTAEALR